MKKAAYAMTFVFLSFLFVMAYYCCYYYATNNMKSGNVKTIYEKMDENPVLDDDYTDAGVSDEIVVTEDTQYILETYDTDDGTITKEEQNVPVELLGLDRNGIIEYLSEYENDEDENVTNMQLVSFSDSCMVIRKSVSGEKESNYSYWIIDESGTVKVYKSDKKELYLDTGIESSSLEKEDKKKLKTGFYIEDIKALYNYLETITS